MDNSEFDIIRVTSADADRVFDFLAKHFYPDEPITKATKHKKEKSDCTSPQVIKANLSLLAVRKDNPDVICGLILNDRRGHDDFFDAMLASRMEKYGGTPYAKIFPLFRHNQINFCQQLEEKYFKGSTNKNTIKVLKISIRDEDRQKGLASFLMNRTMALAEENNFDWAAVECSSFYTSQLCKKMGFTVVSETIYKDYFKDEEGNPTLEIEPPHVALVNLVKKLNPRKNV